jgi:hypothetical protein
METIEVGLGDMVTVANQDTLVVGRICGMTAFQGNVKGVQIEELNLWLDAEDGWRVVERIEETDPNEI